MAKGNIIPVFIPHLGCPHACVFCDQKRISGAASPAAPADVTTAIERGLEKSETPPQLAFYGGSFTAIPAAEQEALLAAALPYVQSGRLSGVRLSTRPDCIDPETLDRLARYGVDTVELGAQSMDEHVLKACGRGHSASDTVNASRLIRERGFSLVLQMMTGLPGSDRERDVETARRLIGLAPDAARIYPTVVLRGTMLHRLWQAGAYAEHTVEDAVETCAAILPLFENAGIPVIRIGLNPSADLSAGEAVAGAYHPALGELVKGRVLLHRARAVLAHAPRGRSVTLTVGKGRASQMAGQHRCNLTALEAEFGYEKITIREREQDDGEVGLGEIMP